MMLHTQDTRSMRNLVSEAWRKRALSVFAVTLMMSQFYAGFKLYNDNLWPFTSYPMYAESHRVGDATKTMKLHGITISGRSVAIKGRDFGLTYYGLWNRIMKRIWGGTHQKREAYFKQLVSIYNKTRTDPQDRLVRLEFIYKGRVMKSGGFSDPYQRTKFTYQVGSGLKEYP